MKTAGTTPCATTSRRRLKPAALSALLISGILLSAGTVRAGEHVTLRNGFDLICDHREVTGNRVRLYTGPKSFVEVAAADISQIEQIEWMPNAIAPLAAVDALSLHPATPVFAPEVSKEELRELIAKAGHQHNVDVDLLASLVRAESGGKVHAVSRTGARGLMQLMPGTANDLGVKDSFQADQNINGGTAYLDLLLAKYHDNLALALAAYNAGPAAVDRYHGVPPYRETRAYVARVIREFNRLGAARATAKITAPNLKSAETAAMATPSLPAAGGQQ